MLFKWLLRSIWFLCVYPKLTVTCKHCTWAGGCNGPTKSTFCYTIYSAMTGEAIRFGCASEREMSSLVSVLPPLPKWCTVGVNQTAVCACRVDAFTPFHASNIKQPHIEKLKDVTESSVDIINSITIAATSSTNQPIFSSTILPTQDPSYADSWYYQLIAGSSTQTNMKYNKSDLYPATRSPAVIPVISTVEPPEFPDERAISHYLSAEIGDQTTSLASSTNYLLIDNLIVIILCYILHSFWSNKN